MNEEPDPCKARFTNSTSSNDSGSGYGARARTGSVAIESETEARLTSLSTGSHLNGLQQTGTRHHDHHRQHQQQYQYQHQHQASAGRSVPIGPSMQPFTTPAFVGGQFNRISQAAYTNAAAQHQTQSHTEHQEQDYKTGQARQSNQQAQQSQESPNDRQVRALHTLPQFSAGHGIILDQYQKTIQHHRDTRPTHESQGRQRGLTPPIQTWLQRQEQQWDPVLMKFTKRR